MMLFFLVAAVAMITEKLSFPYFYDNHCYGNKFLHQDSAAYQSKLSLKKLSQTDKEFSRKSVIKVHPLPHCNDADSSNKVKTHYFFFFLISAHFTCCLTYLIFINPLDGCSKKKNMRKLFVTHQKLFNNIS